MARVFELSTHTLSVEVAAALSLALTEERASELQAIASSTSGIVLENTDSWGRLRNDYPTSRRVILSADGLKTTYLDQVGKGSQVIWDLFRSYKQDIYAYWFALKDAFELVSKDVRGDDFWLLSPQTFKNPLLRELGPEVVMLYVAHAVEAHARLVSVSPEYSVLARGGTHVAVSADKIEIIPLGTLQSTCLDVHATKMSTLHRIRGAANPGEVLIDVEDPALFAAATGSPLLRTGPANIDLSFSDHFPDMQRLPKTLALFGVGTHPELEKLLQQAKAMAVSSPYRRTAA
jgi:hypothetical protein